jgi:hypothetical protein
MASPISLNPPKTYLITRNQLIVGAAVCVIVLVAAVALKILALAIIGALGMTLMFVLRNIETRIVVSPPRNPAPIPIPIPVSTPPRASEPIPPPFVPSDPPQRMPSPMPPEPENNEPVHVDFEAMRQTTRDFERQLDDIVNGSGTEAASHTPEEMHEPVIATPEAGKWKWNPFAKK